MKSWEIQLNLMRSCEILWICEIQQISAQIWWTSGGFQIMQILFIFTTDFICRFQCVLHYGFHCGFHLWILWIPYEIHLIPYEKQKKVKNLTWIICSYWFQVDFMCNLPDFTEICWISCEICQILWNPPGFMKNVKSARFCEIWQISCAFATK